MTSIIIIIFLVTGCYGYIKVDCPATGKNAWSHLHRVDCFPEGNTTRKNCKSRGCCWSPHPDNTRAPSCIFPDTYGYYATDMKPIFWDKGVWTAHLTRYDTPSLYGDEVPVMGLRVEQQGNHRLRIKLYDAKKARFEVPATIAEPEQTTNPLYDVKFTKEPFSVKVIRKSNGRTIFDTSLGGLVFSNQFLQLSAHIASGHVYGLGEHLHERFKHDINWVTWSIHAAGKHPTGPEARNLYGSHPVYLNIEEDGNANMVLLLNQHAMDVVLQPGPGVTFRTIGGVLDFYIYVAEWGHTPPVNCLYPEDCSEA